MSTGVSDKPADVALVLKDQAFPLLRIAIIASSDLYTDRDFIASLLEKAGCAVWTDACLLPGQDWALEESKALRNAHFILVLTSRKSPSMEGAWQGQIKKALGVYDQKPEGTIHIIPCLMESCDGFRSLEQFYPVKLYEGLPAWKKLITAFATEWQKRTKTGTWH